MRGLEDSDDLGAFYCTHLIGTALRNHSVDGLAVTDIKRDFGIYTTIDARDDFSGNSVAGGNAGSLRARCKHYGGAVHQGDDMVADFQIEFDKAAVRQKRKDENPG